MKTLEVKIYKFSELSEEAKKKAIEHFNDINISYDGWSDFVLENFKEENKYFEVGKIYFSGFWSQGDGAMFEYSSVSQELINEAIESLNLPTYKKNAIKKGIYITAKGKHSGHYYHEKCVHHGIYIESEFDNRPNLSELIYEMSEQIEAFIIDKYEELAKGLYSDLENEYNYLTSEEAIIEAIEANDYEFLKTE